MSSDFAYSAPRKALHWLTAAAMLAAFGLAWGRLAVEEPALRIALLSWHRGVGLAVLVAALVRLALRARDGAAPPLPGQPRLQALAAAAVHGGLYALMLAQPLLGWAYVSAKGRPFALGPVTLPALAPKSAELADLFGLAHQVCGYALAGAIVLHVAATAYHVLWQREPLLARMLPSSFGASCAPVVSGEQHS